MDIDAGDVWISEEYGLGMGGATRLTKIPEAEGKTFDGLEEVQSFIKEHMDGGEYRILLTEGTVTVPNKYESVPAPLETYSDYQASLVNSTYNEVVERDDVLTSHLADSKDQRSVQAMNADVTLKLSPYEYDIYAGLKLNSDDDESQVAKEFADTYSEFRLVGFKRSTYHRSRGARGTPMVNVYLRLPTGNRSELDTLVEHQSSLEQFYDAASLTYNKVFIPDGVTPEQESTDVVLLTGITIADNDFTGLYPPKSAEKEIPKMYTGGRTGHLSEAIGELDNWAAHSLGHVAATGKFKMAIGLIATDPNTLLPPED